LPRSKKKVPPKAINSASKTTKLSTHPAPPAQTPRNRFPDSEKLGSFRGALPDDFIPKLIKQSDKKAPGMSMLLGRYYIALLLTA
jgi:hypothetical protein